MARPTLELLGLELSMRGFADGLNAVYGPTFVGCSLNKRAVSYRVSIVLI